MSEIVTTTEPSLEDKQKGKEFFYTMPMLERMKPVRTELAWVLLGRMDAGGHQNLLPNYCYNIHSDKSRSFVAPCARPLKGRRR